MKVGLCDVSLFDDGTQDTVFSVESKYGSTQHRFCPEYANVYRDDNGSIIGEGFIDLAYEAVDAHIQKLAT